MLIPLGSLNLEKVKELNVEDKKNIVIHCRSGGRSLAACKLLVQEDPKLSVHNLEGGITSWLQYKNHDISISVGGCSSNANTKKKSGGCSSN